MWYVSSQFVAEIETRSFPETGGGHIVHVLRKVAWRLSSEQYATQTSVKTIAQEINLEQVISPQMPRIVSRVILVRDIDPSF